MLYLGLETDGGIQYKPKIVRSLASHLIVQISCGYKHCMALTSRKSIFIIKKSYYFYVGTQYKMRLNPIYCMYLIIIY